MAFDTSTGTTTIGSTCTAYAGAAVTITAPSDGYVVASAQVQLRIDHTNGQTDRWYVSVGAPPTDCDSAVYGWVDTVEEFASTDGAMRRSAYAQRAFSVTAGNYSYYVVGYMSLGQSAGDVFWYGNMVAVFYPV
jgi:hypothetical protein